MKFLKKISEFWKQVVACKNFDFVIVLALTLSAYFYLFGWVSLDPYNVDYALRGGDFTVTYLGSIFYRMDEWRWPLLTHANLAYPYGTSVHGTDGSPLWAFIFKVIHKAFNLPADLQFFGIWMLMCYVLQAYFSVRIFRHAFKNKFLIILGACFFVSAPIMMVRLYVHVNLQCHFILLWAILLWMNNKIGRRQWIEMGVLVSLGTLMCPYFLPMIGGFFALLFYQQVWVEKKLPWLPFIKGVVALALVFGFWLFMLGMVQTGQVLTSGGWRGLSLNLTALFNPVWSSSRVFNTLTPKADFDADNYFGFGLLILLVLCFPKVKALFEGDNLKKHAPLALLLFGFFLFAVSPQIKCGTAIILDYNPGKWIDWLGDVFRYSGRFFWPIWYLLAFFLIKTFAAQHKKAVFVVLPLLLAIQTWDLYPCWVGKGSFVKDAPKMEYPFYSPEWDRLNKQYKNIFIFAHNNGFRDMWRWAIKNNKNVNYGFLNRPPKKTLNMVERVQEELLNGYVSNPDYFYVIDSDLMKILDEMAAVNPAVATLKTHIKHIDNYDILEYVPELMAAQKSFEKQYIKAAHAYWTSTLEQISPYRLVRDVDGKFKDYASIIQLDDKVLKLKWDKYDVEEFERRDDGVYYQKGMPVE